MSDPLIDLRIPLTYLAMLIPSVIFLVAAGALFFRQRSVSAGLFFGGSLAASIAHIVNTVGVFYLSRNYEAQTFTNFMMIISAVSFFALLAQAVGLLIFALELPKKQTESP